jgi:hypothetical protein
MLMLELLVVKVSFLIYDLRLQGIYVAIIVIHADLDLKQALFDRVLIDLVAPLLTGKLLLQVSDRLHFLLYVIIHLRETRSVILVELVFDANLAGIALVTHEQNVFPITDATDQGLVSRISHEQPLLMQALRACSVAAKLTI